MKYPIYIPELTIKERTYVLDCIDSTWISSKGKYVQKFEQLVAEYVGVKHAISVFNGTVALHLALLAIDIQADDEVIVPDFTYIASANSILHAGAKPILIDVDRNSWNITAKTIEKAITPKTKAILLTDIYGTPPEMEAIWQLAEKYNIKIIEDAAESLGATYNATKAGNLGYIATFSFFGNKTITTGEGGMVLTNDSTIAKKMAQIKNQGNSKTVRYFHDMLGYNYRMTNIQAAIGCGQMERIEDILHRKTQIFNHYKTRLAPRVQFQDIPSHIKSSYWMVGFLVGSEQVKQKIRTHLITKGIETRPFFFPVSEMPFYKTANTPVSKELSQRGLLVPSYPALTERDVDYIADCILESIN